MLSKLLPREESFFDIFEEHAKVTLECAREFAGIAAHFDQLATRAETIKALEHQADSITHHCVEALHKTFITPLERDDIFRLISGMDDVVDYIDAAADCLTVYKIKEMLPEAKELATVIVNSVLEIEKAVKGLRNMDNIDKIRSNCAEINRLENLGDQLLRQGVGKLFEEQSDVRMIIKWKEILEYLENATDRCEDVANILEGVMLENG